MRHCPNGEVITVLSWRVLGVEEEHHGVGALRWVVVPVAAVIVSW